MMKRELSQIRAYRQQCQRRTGNLYDTLFVRRVSIFFTLALFKSRLGVTPNAVSFANLLVGSVACFVIGTARGPDVLYGIALMHLYSVLDSVDGELARLTGKTSLKGLFLEDLSAYWLINAFWIAAGWHLYGATGSWRYPVVGVGIVALGRNVMPAARRAVLKAVVTQRPLDPGTPDPRTEAARNRQMQGLSRLRAWVDESLLHPTNVWVACTSSMVVEVVARPAGIPLLAGVYVVYAVLSLVRELSGAAYMAFGKGLETQLLQIYANTREIPGHEEAPADKGPAAPSAP